MATPQVDHEREHRLPDLSEDKWRIMRTSTILISTFSILLVTAPISGCGWLRWSSASSTKRAETVVKRPGRVTPPVQKATSDVEVLWEIPTAPVDGFIISYGYGEEEISHRVKVKATELNRYEDHRYGFVYRFILRDIPTDRSLKVVISSFSGDKVSEASKVIVVPSESALPG